MQLFKVFILIFFQRSIACGNSLKQEIVLVWRNYWTQWKACSVIRTLMMKTTSSTKTMLSVYGCSGSFKCSRKNVILDR